MSQDVSASKTISDFEPQKFPRSTEQTVKDTSSVAHVISKNMIVKLKAQ